MQGSKCHQREGTLCNVFVANGYLEEMTSKSLNNQKGKAVSQREEEDVRTDTLCLPYIRGLSKNVENAMKYLKIRTVFK